MGGIAGVEPREKSIRVKFTFQGQTRRETLYVNGKPLPPTPANLKYAGRLITEIRERIAQDRFDYAEYFPNSPHAQVQEKNPNLFGDLADLWLQAQGRLSKATKSQYRSAINCWKKLIGEKTPVKSLTHLHLAAKIGGHEWPSAKTHNNYMIALRGVLGLVYRGDLSGKNPVIGIENMKVTKRLPDPLTAKERDKILEDIQQRYDPRVYAYFLWQFYTGMRPEETIALRWSDVDWNQQTIRVQRVRSFRGNESEDTKTFVQRDVDLLPQALQALQIMKPYTFMKRVDMRSNHDTAADIFERPPWQPEKGSLGGKPSPAGPWNDERVQRDTYWRPTLKRLKIRWRRPYNCRHTFASVALMTGVAPAYIAAQLGHSVKMLLEVYAKWIPENDGNTAREKLRAAMAGNAGELEGSKLTYK